MLNKCFSSGCPTEVAVVCTCTNSKTYICANHINEHFLNQSTNSHNVIPLLSPLQPDHLAKTTSKIQLFLSHLLSLKSQTICYTNSLIQCISQNSQSALKLLSSLESELIQTYEKIKSRNLINKLELEQLETKSLSVENCSFLKFSKIRDDLSSFFEIKPFEKDLEIELKCDKMFFSKDKVEGGLWEIDLETFKLKDLGYAKIGGEGGACKVSKEIYFFNGGIKKNPVGETYLVNTKDCTVEILPNSMNRRGNACVYKDGNAYTFGGYDGKIIATCQVYEMASKQWKNITDLPSPSFSNTASIVNNQILLTGYSLNKVYSYENSNFSEIFNFAKSGSKILCGGWIVTSLILYENEENKNSVWKQHHIKGEVDALSVFTSFKRDNFIYFIVSKQHTLWRINTVAKNIELVKYN